MVPRWCAGVEVRRQHAAARIMVAAQQLLELIENTLEVGKVDAGRGEPRLEAVYLPAFWSELGRGCDEMRHARQVRLEWETRTVPETSVRTDPRKLTIAIRNLVSNALKFTEEGFVRVEVSAEVMDSERSVVFEQAENRLHAQNAVLIHNVAPTAS